MVRARRASPPLRGEKVTAPLPCPDCRKGTLQIHADGRVGVPVVSPYHHRDAEVPLVWMARPYASCNASEFCIENDPRQP
jgi:hypothetical protein